MMGGEDMEPNLTEEEEENERPSVLTLDQLPCALPLQNDPWRGTLPVLQMKKPRLRDVRGPRPLASL